jgi:centromere/kinetochore protein ZW10
MDQVGVGKSCRIVRLLDHRAFELKANIHEVFNNVWKDLVHFDVEQGKVAIRDSLPGEQRKFRNTSVALFPGLTSYR